MRKRKVDLFEEQLKDLGFGSKVTQASGQRLLNRDGSFNVRREGLPFFESLHLYHSLLTMSWLKFHLFIFAAYLAINALFGGIYLLIGLDSLTGVAGSSLYDRFLEAFFFSVQTFTTVGYGHITPRGVVPNMVATIDSFVGLLSFALATGLLFARFSRPTTKIIFSRTAIIAPYRGITGFEFRIANIRKTELIDVEARVIYSRLEDIDGKMLRRFYELPLERSKVAFFPLHWTIVHPIDEESPLYGETREDFQRSESEFFIQLTAYAETFSQTVHTRSSYRFDEVIWGAKFSNIFQEKKNGIARIDLSNLHQIERV